MPVATSPVSERKAAANRENAKRSTGPKTAEGKAKVSLNALTHGLASSMVVLPTEDRAEFETMRAAWYDDWKPPTDARRVLVDQAAATAWRLRRCVRVETARITDRMNEAVADYDARVEARMAEAYRVFNLNPRQGLKAFLAEYEGVAALIREWRTLGARLTDPSDWKDEASHDRLVMLLGYPSGRANQSQRALSDYADQSQEASADRADQTHRTLTDRANQSQRASIERAKQSHQTSAGRADQSQRAP